MATLTTDMILVMVIIAITIFLFVVEWLRVDVVAILIMVTLPLLGLVTVQEAFSGLSSNAVISIIAVIIIGAGLNKTGLINGLVKPVLRIAGDSPSRVVIAISVTVAMISSFMQNIGAAALFLPAIQRIGKRLNIPVSRLLMPIGFSAILGGTITLVGSSPLIILNDLLVPFELEPFGLFDVTPIGLTLVASGLACFMVLGRFILPKPQSSQDGKKAGESQVAPEPEDVERSWELHTPIDYTHYREPVTVADLRERYLAKTVAIVEPPDFHVFSPPGNMEIHANVDLTVFAREEDVRRLAEDENMVLKPRLEVFAEALSEEAAGVVEAVVAPRSGFVGKSLEEIEFEERFQVVPIALHRDVDTYRSEITEIPLRVGDVLHLHGTWRRLHFLHSGGDLLFTMPVEIEETAHDKVLIAAFWLVVALTMIIFFKVKLSVSLMTGALGMIITRVLDIDEAYKAVDWRTVFLLGGLIPLGLATENTGTAAWIAQTTLHAIGPTSPIVLIGVIGVLSTFFTLVISNVGATVLLVPLVVNMAITAGADPRMAALAVGLATSNSFMLPTHQVNALYMGPGQYRSKDFLKAGSVVSVVFLIVMIAMMYVCFGI